MWGAAQRMTARMLSNRGTPVTNPDLRAEAEVLHSVLNATAGVQRPLRVLIDQRTAKGMRGRVIGNIPHLLTMCARDGPTIGVECTNYTFGVRGLRADVTAVRQADVLVGMHGSGLTNGFFMRRRSALVEVRPFGFDGAWADLYYKEPFAHPRNEQPRVFYSTIVIGSPELCNPNIGYAIRPQFASYVKYCHLPWEALRRALRIISWWTSPKPYSRRSDGSSDLTPEERYSQSAWATKTIVAYASEPGPRGTRRPSRGAKHLSGFRPQLDND